jgi:hypothetical protein
VVHSQAAKQDVRSLSATYWIVGAVLVFLGFFGWSDARKRRGEAEKLAREQGLDLRELLKRT